MNVTIVCTRPHHVDSHLCTALQRTTAEGNRILCANVHFFKFSVKATTGGRCSGIVSSEYACMHPSCTVMCQHRWAQRRYKQRRYCSAATILVAVAVAPLHFVNCSVQRQRRYKFSVARLFQRYSATSLLFFNSGPI